MDPEPARAQESFGSLLLPLRERGSAWLAALALLAYFAATAARDLSLYDSGELALAAVKLGLGHPPGQPLHTLFGFVLSHLPGVPALVGACLASAVPAALTVLPATSIAQTLAGAAAPRFVQRALPWLIALIALHTSVWEPATRVEVYALCVFFAVWATARLASSPGAGSEIEPRRAVRHVLQAGVALGLCAAVNPMIALCAGIAVAPNILLRIARRELPPRALVYAVCGGILGLSPYAYLFLIRGRTDVMIWGAPRNAASLWRYLSLRDYSSNQGIDAATWLMHGLAWLGWAVQHWLAPLLVLGFAGHVSGRSRSTLGVATFPILLFLLVAVISFNVNWKLEIPDYNGYVDAALWLAAAGAAAFCAHAFTLGRAPSAGVLAAVLVACSLAAPPAVPVRTRHRDHLARQLAERVLREAPAHAIVIADADHFAGSLFYLQEAERQRPDVVVLAYGLASSSWHWERLAHMHPDLVPVSLPGPGGKVGRVQRLLRANPARAVIVERFEIAQALGLRACAGGLYLRTGSACTPATTANPEPARFLAAALAELGEGSPDAAGAITGASYSLGESLWRAGYPRAALTVLLAGVPKAIQPHPTPALPDLDRVPALTAPLPSWQRGAALGDPGRNLFVAGALAAASGQSEAGAAYLRAAAETQLPEASALLRAAP